MAKRRIIKESEQDLHRTFVKFVKKNFSKFSRLDTLPRPISKIQNEDGVVELIFNKDNIFEKKLKLNIEAIPYIFLLDGYPKKLLMFILLDNFDETTCEYNWSAQKIELFQNFCKSINSTQTCSVAVAKKAHRRLVDENATLSKARGIYMLNPLIAGGNIVSARRELIYSYSNLLIQKNGNAQSKFYPKNK
jgi:hypothetical protein